MMTERPVAREPVWPGDFPDPFLLRHEIDGGGYVAFATGNVGDDGRAFRTLMSRELHHWTPGGGALIPPPGTADQSFWAPEVAQGDDDRFYMYYSVGRESEQRHVLRVAICHSPFGPFVDTGVPLIDPTQQRFVIDPHPFREMDGTWWLFYARDYLDGPRPGTALAVDRLIDMTTLAGEERPVLRAEQEWTLFEGNRPMQAYGDTFDWHTLEGPCVVHYNDRYHLFYSGARYDSDRYGVDWAESDSITGPYRRVSHREGEAEGPQFLRTIAGRIHGPGHHSVSSTPDGQQIVAFHAWDAALKRRQMHLTVLTWENGRPRADLSAETWTQTPARTA